MPAGTPRPCRRVLDDGARAEAHAPGCAGAKSFPQPSPHHPVSPTSPNRRRPLQDLHRAELAYTVAIQTSAPELNEAAAKAAEDVAFLCAVDLPRHMLSAKVGGSIGAAREEGAHPAGGGSGGSSSSAVNELPLNRIGGASADTLSVVIDVRRWQRQLTAVFEEVSDKNAGIRFSLEGQLRDRKAAAETQLAGAAAEIDRIRGTSEQALSKGLAGAKAVADEIARVSTLLDAVRQELAAVDQASVALAMHSDAHVRPFETSRSALLSNNAGPRHPRRRALRGGRSRSACAHAHVGRRPDGRLDALWHACRRPQRGAARHGG